MMPDIWWSLRCRKLSEKVLRFVVSVNEQQAIPLGNQRQMPAYQGAEGWDEA